MSKIFDTNLYTKIYVVCPANNKTGGTELLHQLVYHLNLINKKAVVAYYLEGKQRQDGPVPAEFLCYVKEYCYMKDVIDSADNILILPEVCIGKHRKYKKIQKCIWWLSVDNFMAISGRINRLKRYGILSFLKHLWLNDYNSENDLKKISIHLYQSYYARNFLIEQKNIADEKLFYLSDYINDIYLNNLEVREKEDMVIYNPKKGRKFTEKLIAASSEIKWVPIQNMTNVEVQELMRRAKVYVDFGNHPGKDRIPREAAMSGCCIITSRQGAAGYHEDVAINEEYKFADEDRNIMAIVGTIKRCLEDYDTIYRDFFDYREIIKSEKIKFLKDIERIFQ